MKTTSKTKTKSAPAAKRTRKLPSVTLRQIEAAGPCTGEYFGFLTAIKSNPVPGGYFADVEKDVLEYYGFRKRKVSAYGPDDPIALADILKTKGGERWMDGLTRVKWLLDRVPELSQTNVRVDRRESEIRENAFELALKELAA